MNPIYTASLHGQFSDSGSEVKSQALTAVKNMFCCCFFPESKDKRCFTPIHCASLTGNADCISRLLDGGSEVNSRGFAGATPLHITVC